MFEMYEISRTSLPSYAGRHSTTLRGVSFLLTAFGALRKKGTFCGRTAARLEPRRGREHPNQALKISVRSLGASTFHRFKDSAVFALEKFASRRVFAAIAGAMVLPAGAAIAETAALPTRLSVPAVIEAAEAEAREDSSDQLQTALPSESCLSNTICALKNRMRWRTAAWSPSYCTLIARGVLSAAEKYKLSPALILAVMINESDLNEQAVATHFRDGTLYAKDSGLMGIRCVVGKDGRCTNGNVRGLSWKMVMDPVKNIELGARELAHYRDGGGVTRVTVRSLDRRSGRVVEKTKTIRCEHKTHAYWAHYNHGPRYIEKGHPRHYPHRVAVLYHALAGTLELPAPELERPVTIRDPGKRERTADRPIEARYRVLCEKIRSVAGVCTEEPTLRTAAVN
jgi:soluble lytic murein transglycosylase-like protein